MTLNEILTYWTLSGDIIMSNSDILYSGERDGKFFHLIHNNFVKCKNGGLRIIYEEQLHPLKCTLVLADYVENGSNEFRSLTLEELFEI